MYRLEFSPEPWAKDPKQCLRGLRWLLKRAGRTYGLRCRYVSADTQPSDRALDGFARLIRAGDATLEDFKKIGGDHLADLVSSRLDT